MLVEFTLKGLSAEKLLNEAGRRGVTLRAVRRRGRSVTARCGRGDFAVLRALAEEKGFEVSALRPVGALKWGKRAKRRPGLLIGAALCVALAAYASGFVWRVDVVNAGAYEGEVRRFLQEKGAAPLARKSAVNPGKLQEELTWYLPQVKWVRVQWQGMALRVSVDEGVPPPEAEAAGAPGDVVAARDGVVSRIVTYAGTPRVKPGDFVREGQVLIEGKEKGAGGEDTPVKARGSVTARAWETAAARLPTTEEASVPTGRRAERRVIVTPFFAWSAQAAPLFLTADREIRETPVGGAWVPAALRKETYEEVSLEKKARPGEEAAREAEALALRRLEERLKNAETVDKWINFRMIEGDTVVVEAAGEMLLEIGRYRKNAP